MTAVLAPGFPESLRVRRDARGRFGNTSELGLPTFRDVARWKFGFGPREKPAVDPARVPPGGAPVAPLDGNRLRAPDPRAVQLTWIGHSTWLIQAAGRTIVTDPIFSDYCAPVRWPPMRRRTPPAATLAELPAPDLVLLSHAHYDHCDWPSLRDLGRDPDYAVPLGLGSLVRRAGAVRVHDAEWGQQFSWPELRLTFVPAHHFSARTAFDRNVTLWGGWLLEIAGRRVYFAGDTAWAPSLADLARWMAPVDVALLPIGAYRPRWFMHRVHCDAAEAVQLHRLVGARRSLAMHWGAFALTDEPLGEPPVFLRDAAEAAGVGPEEFQVLAIGETVVV